MAKAKSEQQQFIQPKAKTTSIGNGRNSRPRRRGRKAYRGQGKR